MGLLVGSCGLLQNPNPEPVLATQVSTLEFEHLQAYWQQEAKGQPQKARTELEAAIKASDSRYTVELARKWLALPQKNPIQQHPFYDFLQQKLKRSYQLSIDKLIDSAAKKHGDRGEVPTLSQVHPLDQKKVDSYCGTYESHKTQWQRWAQSLTADENKLWQVLIFDCQGIRPLEKIKLLQAWIDQSTHFRQKYREYEFFVRNLLVVLLRRNGLRFEAADEYLWISQIASERKAFRTTYTGMADEELDYQRANVLIWSARYQAFTGRYKLALRHIELARAVIHSYWNAGKSEQQHRFEELYAETFHVEAFRVYLSQGDYQKALYINTLALKYFEWQEKWQQNFLWYQGLYHFILKQYDLAFTHWQKLPQDHSRNLYWLSKVAILTGQHKLATSLKAQLLKQHPLSYYSVVSYGAIPEFVGDGTVVIGTLPEKNSSMGEETLKMLRKARQLVEQQQCDSAIDLLGFVSKEVKLNQSLGLQVIPLHYQCENYHVAIDLVTRILHQLADGEALSFLSLPGILQAYFPMPFLTRYLEASQNNGEKAALMLAISRQESGFNPQAMSFAGAYGLMQIIVPTAAEYRPMDSNHKIVEELLRGDSNIQIGAEYTGYLIQKYRGDYVTMLAAYNAGPVVADRWEATENTGFDQDLQMELIPFHETRSYVKKVLRNMKIYSHLLSGKYVAGLAEMR